VINHVRTLLLNRDGEGNSPGPGEEYTPPAYREVELPPELQKVRDVLFGASPDRRMLLYRLRQFMALLHSTPLSPFVTMDDPRITYRLDAEPGLQPSLEVTDPGHPLYVAGPRPVTATGIATQVWECRVSA
jgi:hypothetical protein